MKKKAEGTNSDATEAKFSLHGEEVGCLYFENKGFP